MSIKRFALVGAGVVVVLAVALAFIVPALTARPFERVFIGGDSLAGGYFASTVDKGFRERVFAALDNGPHFEPLSYGFPHGRLSEIVREKLPKDLDLAIIEIGTNDFGRTPLRKFRETYDGFLAALKGTSPHVRLLCLGVWQNPSAVVDGLTPGDYDREIQGSCENAGGQFMQLKDIYIWDGSRGPVGVQTETGVSDGFHPNDLGHERIFNAIMKKLGR